MNRKADSSGNINSRGRPFSGRGQQTQRQSSTSEDIESRSNSSDNFHAHGDDEVREQTRKRKVENEQRRSAIWQAESVPSRTIAAPSSVDDITIANNTSQSTPSRSRLSTFLSEKNLIATRSLRRLSSRRSQLSSSSQHSYTASTVTPVSEKTAIADRSNRRIAMRQASGRSSHCQKQSPSTYMQQASVCDPKPGTAEMILPTVTESLSHDTTDCAQLLDIPSFEQEVCVTSNYPGNLVTAVVVYDEEEEGGPFVNNIPYAAEVVVQTRSRLPMILCLTLVVLIIVNLVVVLSVVKYRSQQRPAMSTATVQHPSDTPLFGSEDASVPMPSPTSFPTYRPTKRDPAASSSNKLENSRTKTPSTIDNKDRPLFMEPSLAPSIGEASVPRTSPPLDSTQPSNYPSSHPSIDRSFAPTQMPSITQTDQLDIFIIRGYPYRPTIATDVVPLPKTQPPSSSPSAAL